MTVLARLPLVLALTLVSLPTGGEYADVVLNTRAEAEEMRPVIFPHWFHRIRFRCKVCHLELGFIMKAGANEITMEKIVDGRYCGRCHNGEIAWTVDNCDLCHSGKFGLETGVLGGASTSGPGRY